MMDDAPLLLLFCPYGGDRYDVGDTLMEAVVEQKTGCHILPHHSASPSDQQGEGMMTPAGGGDDDAARGILGGTAGASPHKLSGLHVLDAHLEGEPSEGQCLAAAAAQSEVGGGILTPRPMFLTPPCWCQH